MQEKKLCRTVRQVEPSPIREMFTKATEYENVISLGIGEPDFHTPAPVSQSALEDALAGYTHYTASQGQPELLDALTAYLNPNYGGELKRENIMLTVGGMGALVGSFRAIFDPGDEIIVPEPYFPAYKAMIALSDGVMVNARTTFEDGFTVKPEEIERRITPKTKAILLNSPNNPTGAMIPKEDLDQIAELVKKHDLLVISDEVYDRFVFDNQKHDSIYNRPGMAERTLVIGSFSKAFAMTGWRLGWVFGPKELIAGVLKVTTFYTSCPSSVSQRAGLAALNQPEETWLEISRAFEKRRDIAYEALSAMDGVKVHKPAGSFYIFPSIKELTDDTLAFSLELLDKKQVVVVPGSGFGPSGTDCVRLACTVSEKDLTLALEKMADFCKAFK